MANLYKKFAAWLLAFLISCPAWAQATGGDVHFHNATGGGGSTLSNALVPSADPTNTPNGRIFNVSNLAGFLTTVDNGAGMNFDLNYGASPLGLTRGGTGGASRQAGINSMLNDGTQATGDIYYYNGTNWVIFHKGANGTYWGVDGSGNVGYFTPNGSGTVNNGTSGRLAWYSSTGTAVSGNANVTISTAAVKFGVAGTSQGSLELTGLTSGSNRITVPAIAGTSTVFPLPGASPAANTVHRGLSGTTSDWGAVANSYLATMANNTIKGNISGSTATPSDLTGTQVTAILDVFSNSAKGLVPAGGGGSATVYLNGAGGFTTPSGGTIGGSIASGQVAVGSGTNTISGSAGVTATGTGLATGITGVVVGSFYAAGGTTNGGDVNLSGGTGGINNQGQLVFHTATGATWIYLTAKNNTAAVHTLGANPTIDGAALTEDTSGNITPNIFKNTPAFGGDGSSGAISYTTTQTPTGPWQLNATTCSFGSGSGTISITPTASPAIINCTQTFVCGVSGQPCNVVLTGTGGIGGATSVAGIYNFGGGPGGGHTGAYNVSSISGAGGGYYGIGGGGSGSGFGAGASGGGGQGYPFSIIGGSGGSAGSGSVTSAGGSGGGSLYVCSVGNLTLASGANFQSLGAQGVDSATNSCLCGAGGSGGSIGLFSQGQITVAVGATVNASGGRGGNATGTGAYGGSGGSCGRIVGISTTTPSISGTITMSGGVAGTGTTSPGVAGSSGSAVWLTGTPNAPLIGYVMDGAPGLDEAIASGESPFVRNLNSRINRTDKGVFMEAREFLKIAAQGDLNTFVQLATETNMDPAAPATALGICDYFDTMGGGTEELANAA